jgi:hypothetical protein
MKRPMLLVLTTALAVLAAGVQAAETEPAWRFNAEYIEACSCNLFCACYFNPTPDKDFCNFNNAIRVKRGHYGDVKLDGMKLWMSGNLGANFADGDLDAVILTFEPSASPAQVDGQAEVKLTAQSGPNGKPVVVNNLKYWGADRNMGFHLYKSEHHYKGHGHDYSYQGANGFRIEIDSGSSMKQARS